MRPSSLAGSLVAVASLMPGCAPPRTVSGLGTMPSRGPDVTVREEWKQPATFTIDLAQPAFLTLFVIAPNHGAELLRTTGRPDSLFAAGTHVLHPVRGDAGRPRGPAIPGEAYPDLAAPCTVTDFVKETVLITPGPGGAEQKTDLITFAGPSTTPPIRTCAVPGIGHTTPTAGVPFDRYLLVLATDKPVARGSIEGVLDELDVTGTPREVNERVATLIARETGTTQWGARAVRF